MKKTLSETVLIAPHFIEQYTIYDEYSELIDGVFYYQDQQIEIRNTSMKIIVGTFGIAGGISFYNIGLTSNVLTLIGALLPFLSLFVLTINLLLDLVYKEGLKLGFFHEASKYEKEHDWIPSYHKCLITETNIEKVKGTKQINFYFGCAAVLMLISALSLFVHFDGLVIRTSIILLFIAAFFAYYLGIKKYLRHPMELQKELEDEED